MTERKALLQARHEGEVPNGIEQVVEAARQLVTAFDGMLGTTTWMAYGYLRSEIEEFELKLVRAGVKL